MIKKTKYISFDMSDENDLERQIVTINNDVYIKKTSIVRNSVRFPIPKIITQDLELQANTPCYFAEYETGIVLIFNNEPKDVSKENVTMRKLLKAGMYDTLYLTIPSKFVKRYASDIKFVKLLHIKEYNKNEWKIQFLFTESI